ncbi:hypothetical protein [Evansella cellulosilytica]|uniref:Uncharacterized protein n=1 Tax=Evansella cellulosilytica (strain ATCC 21833 / DSM 2522 / FERM P-1141 / JCM 9156 / N-4) TaxID=649639 RepID=E6U1Q7_EVAC2|nr:hypothetical protein [Evansella cellulosilytica]ADU31554.1 hypothetical protein Bcell_3312 [Evansella cellulosilytica DSM 2522]
MFQHLIKKFEAKRAVWAEETQQRIMAYAEQERLEALRRMKKEEEQQCLLNNEVEKYLRTVHPTFLLKPEVQKALLNMLQARSEGTVSVNISMTKEMRKAYSYYHSEFKIFVQLLEHKGYKVSNNEELFLNTFITKLREKNYQLCMEKYGDFVPDNATIYEAFEHYFEIVEDQFKYESGNVDFFAIYLNQKGIAGDDWTKSRLKRKLKHYEKANKDEVRMKRLEKRLENIS